MPKFHGALGAARRQKGPGVILLRYGKFAYQRGTSARAIERQLDSRLCCASTNMKSKWVCTGDDEDVQDSTCSSNLHLHPWHPERTTYNTVCPHPLFSIYTYLLFSFFPRFSYQDITVVDARIAWQGAHIHGNTSYSTSHRHEGSLPSEIASVLAHKPTGVSDKAKK